MVEPFTIVTTVASLVCSALKSIQALNAYHGQYNRAAITVASIMAQCSCIEFAIVQVQEVILESSPSAYLLSTDNALTKHFASVFGACEIVFSILIERLKDLSAGEVDERGQLSKMTKLKYVWNDQDMKDLLRNLESQASAFDLLLAALQMRSNVDVHKLLSRKDSRRLLNKVTDNAASLRTAEDTRIQESILENVSILGESDDVEPSLHSTFDEAEFEFDHEIINTTTYRKAFFHVARKNISPPLAETMEGIKMPQNENILEDFRSVLDVAFEPTIELGIPTATDDIVPKCTANFSRPLRKSSTDPSLVKSNQSRSKAKDPDVAGAEAESGVSGRHSKAVIEIENVLIDLEAVPDARSSEVSAISESLYNMLLELEPAESDASVNTPTHGRNVLYSAASLFELNLTMMGMAKTEGGYPYLHYVAGEIFDVIGEKGELWLAINQDDPSAKVGWIWYKHFFPLTTERFESAAAERRRLRERRLRKA